MARQLLIKNTSSAAIPVEKRLVPSGAALWVDEGNVRKELQIYVAGSRVKSDNNEVSATLVDAMRLTGFSINDDGDLVATGERADSLSISDDGELLLELDN